MSAPSSSLLQQLPKFLSAASNRGFLLDLFVLLLNVSGMSFLTHIFVDTLRRGSDDQGAQTILFAMALALFLLAPLGATLKRWHHHQSANKDGLVDPMSSCWFNPIFYFCLTALIFATVDAFILQKVYGRSEPNGDVFVGSVFGGLVLMIIHTVLVYRYFSPPSKAPRFAFFRSRASAFLGDVFLFTNMVLFQLVWNLLTLVKAPHPTGVFDFVARFVILSFLALLLYFPPRMFYLADDIRKKRTWIMILLANAPVMLKFLIGSDAVVQW